MRDWLSVVVAIVGAAITLVAGMLAGRRLHAIAANYLRHTGPAGGWVLAGLVVAALGIARWFI